MCQGWGGSSRGFSGTGAAWDSWQHGSQCLRWCCTCRLHPGHQVASRRQALLRWIPGVPWCASSVLRQSMPWFMTKWAVCFLMVRLLLLQHPSRNEGGSCKAWNTSSYNTRAITLWKKSIKIETTQSCKPFRSTATIKNNLQLGQRLTFKVSERCTFRKTHRGSHKVMGLVCAKAQIASGSRKFRGPVYARGSFTSWGSAHPRQRSCQRGLFTPGGLVYAVTPADFTLTMEEMTMGMFMSVRNYWKYCSWTKWHTCAHSVCIVFVLIWTNGRGSFITSSKKKNVIWALSLSKACKCSDYCRIDWKWSGDQIMSAILKASLSAICTLCTYMTKSSMGEIIYLLLC